MRLFTAIIAAVAFLTGSASAETYILQATDFTGGSLSAAQLSDLTIKVEFGGADLTGGFVGFDANGEYTLSDPSLDNDVTVLVTTKHKDDVLDVFGVRLLTSWTVVYDAINGNGITSENVNNNGARGILKYEYLDVNIHAVDLALDLITDTGTLAQLSVAVDGGAPAAYDQASPTASVLRGESVVVDVYFGGQEITGFGNDGGIAIADGVTKAYQADNGNPIGSPPDFGTAILIQYDLAPVNIFAVDTSFDPVTDSSLLSRLGVSINGGSISTYDQSNPSLSVINGSDVFLTVYFDDEGDGLDAGDELPGFTGNHAGGIGVTSGQTDAYDADTGNTLTVPAGKEQGTALLIHYDIVDLKVLAVDAAFDPIGSSSVLDLLGVSVNGGPIAAYDQANPSVTMLNGEDVFLTVYFDDEGTGLDAGDELTGFTSDHSGGIGVVSGQTQAYVGNDGNALTVPAGKEQGTAILIQYDVTGLNLFAVDTAFDPITDTNVLGLLGVSVNGGAITAYEQAGQTLSMLNGTDVTVKVYFDDEGTGLDAGDELTGFTEDHSGGIGVVAGQSQAYGANDGNGLTIPAGKEQGTAILIQYDIVGLNLFAVDFEFNVITETRFLDLLGYSLNGGPITSYNQSTATLQMLNGDDVSVKVYFDDEGTGLDAGDELTGFTEDHTGGIGITSGQSDVYDADTGNPLTLPAGKEQGTALLIHYDILEVSVFAVDISFDAIADPDALNLMGVSVNGIGPIAYDQTSPILIMLNGATIFVETWFDDEGDGFDAGDQLPFEDQAGGIVLARGVTKAYEAVDGNPLPLPPGKEIGTGMVLQYDVVNLNLFAVDTAFDPITDTTVLGLLGVDINGTGISAYDQVDPTITVLNGEDVSVKVYFDVDADGLDAGDELTEFTADHSGGIGITGGLSQAYDASSGNALTIPAGKEQGSALLIHYNVLPLNVFAVDLAFDVVPDVSALGVSVNGSAPASYTQGAPSIYTMDGFTVSIDTYFDDEGDGFDAGDQLSFEDQSAGIVVAQGVTKAFDAVDGDQLAVPAGKEQGSAILIQYDVLSLNLFAVGTAFDLIADQPVLDLLGISINGGAITGYNQSGASYSILNGNDIFLKVYFDDEGDGLDAGDELTGFTEDHAGGIGVTTGLSQAYDAVNGNPLTIPAGKEQGTAILIHYDVLQLNVFAIDLAFDVISDPALLPRLGVSIDGNGPMVYDQVGSSIITLNGSSISIATYYDDENDGLDAGDMLSFEDQSGGIVVAQNLSKAYDAVDGNPLTIPAGKEQGAAILIQYDVVSVNIFAVDTALDVVADPTVLGALGVSINGGAITSFVQTGPSLSVLNLDDIFLKVYFDDEGTGLDAGDELTGFTEDHTGGIGISSGLTQAYEAVNGNPVTVPAGKEQGTAVLIQFDVIDLNLFATTANLTVIQNPTTLARLTVEVNGVGPVPYVQTGPTLSMLDGQKVFLKVFLDGIEQTGFTEDHVGGIGVADGTTLAYNSLDGNPITPAPSLGTTILIAYDVNSPPIADAGEDRLEPCFSLSKHVVLDGSGSSDPDGDPLTYTWTEGGVVLATGDQATAEQPTVLLALGVHTITLTVEDPVGETDSDEVVITVGDVQPPVVTITSHTDGQWVAKKNNHIAGTVVEAVDLKSVKVNGHGSFSGVAPDFTFSGPTSALQPDGPHVVTVTATDVSDNVGTAEITLNVDTTSPVLTITTPLDDDVLTENPSVVTVSGAVSDAGSGVATVTVNGTPATIDNGVYTADVTVQGNGRRRIRVVATDNVGHDTVASVHVVIDNQPPRVSITSPSNNAVVSQTTITVTGRARDSGRGVESVVVQVDAEPPVVATIDEENETYSAEVDFPAGATNGQYTVTATASDGVLQAVAESVVNLNVAGNDPVVFFRVLDSQDAPVSGVRVDLLKDNGGGTGKRQNTDGSGEVKFIVDPAKSFLFRVYHLGGTYTTSTPTTTTTDPMPHVNTEASTFTLTDSGSSGIEGARVDLLRENGSGTGVRRDTNSSGEAAFEVLPGFIHAFKVYHNGGRQVSAQVTGGEDTGIQTEVSTLTLGLAGGGGVDGARVDLLRSNDSNTGIRSETDGGAVDFEVLPEFVHRFKVYFNGGTFVTGDLTGGADASVTTEVSIVTLTSSSGGGIQGVRVDLLRANGSNTGVRLGTDGGGNAPFHVLPGFAHAFKVYHNGGTFITDPATGGSTTGITTVESEFTLTDSAGAPIVGARVDLLRSNQSNTGIRRSTDGSGVAVFEVLRGYKHRFKVYYHGGSYTTQEVVF